MAECQTNHILTNCLLYVGLLHLAHAKKLLPASFVTSTAKFCLMERQILQAPVIRHAKWPASDQGLRFLSLMDKQQACIFVAPCAILTIKYITNIKLPLI